MIDTESCYHKTDMGRRENVCDGASELGSMDVSVTAKITLTLGRQSETDAVEMLACLDILTEITKDKRKFDEGARVVARRRAKGN